MKRSGYSECQIMAILNKVEAGIAVPDLCYKHGMSQATFYTFTSGAPSMREWMHL